MEGTEIVINFVKAAEITKELHSGDYFFATDEFNRPSLFLFVNENCIIDMETTEEYGIEDFNELEEIKVFKKVIITTEN